MISDVFKKNRVSNSSIEERYLFVLLFLSSLLTAIYEIAIIKQFTVTMYNVQASAFISFAFLHLFSGIGSYFAYRFFDSLLERKNIKLILLSAGLAVIASLFSVLTFSLEHALSVVITVFFVSLAFLILGIIYGLVIIYFCRARGEKTGGAVAISLVGLILGFLIEPYFAVHIGVNASLLLVGGIFVFLCFWNPLYLCIAFPFLLGIFLTVPIDAGIERLRIKTIDTNQRITREKFEKDYLLIFDGWSPYAKLNIFRGKGRKENRFLGAYNYRIFWSYHDRTSKEKRVPFRFINDDDNILIIGASAGQEINRLRHKRKRTKENTMMVEIDPLVVKYFKYDHPEYNDNLYNRVNIIAADGRSVLDEIKEKKDVIIIGTLESAGRNIWMFSEFKNNLFTMESFKRCFQILGDTGVLMIYRDENNLVFVNSICAALKKLGAHFLVYRIPFYEDGKEFGSNRFYIYASYSPKKINNIGREIEYSGIDNERVNIGDAPILSDDRNFTNMISASAGVVLRTFSIAFATILLLMSAAILFVRRKQSRRIMLYFFLIGNGFFLTQLFLIAKFRSFFGQPLKTFMVVTSVFLLSVSIGNILSRRILSEQLKKRFFHHGLAVILILLWFNIAISHIPFAKSYFIEKLLAALIIIAPMGLLCGFYYPLGLILGRNEHLGLAIFFDSLGACLAFFLFYLLYWISGISVNFYPIAFSYLAATILISLCYSYD